MPVYAMVAFPTLLSIQCHDSRYPARMYGEVVSRYAQIVLPHHRCAPRASTAAPHAIVDARTGSAIRADRRTNSHTAATTIVVAANHDRNWGRTSPSRASQPPMNHGKVPGNDRCMPTTSQAI